MLEDLRQRLREVFQSVLRRSEDFVDAAKEFSILFAVSNAPFAALVLVHIISTKGAIADYGTVASVVADNVKSGEVFIYVTASLAPFVFVMTQYARARRHFPFYTVFLGMTAVVYSVCLIIFSMYRVGQIQNQEFVSGVSKWLYFFSLALWYASLVFARKLMRPVTSEQSGADAIMNELRGLEK